MIREDIKSCIRRKPKDFEEFLRFMAELGYEVKQGKNISFKGAGQERFIRMRSLGENYSEEAVRDMISGKRILGTETGQMPKAQTFNLLIDIQARMADKRSPAYRRWATVYNLKQMSSTFMFLRENHIESFEELDKRTEEAVQKFNELNESIKASEKRLAEILALKKHILNYRKTKDTYVAYRKAGYSRKFFEEHRQEIALHKAAKAAFDQLGTEKLPTMRELNEEYDSVLRSKKVAYVDYRIAKKEMQEYLKAGKNVNIFYKDDIENDKREPAL